MPGPISERADMTQGSNPSRRSPSNSELSSWLMVAVEDVRIEVDPSRPGDRSAQIVDPNPTKYFRITEILQDAASENRIEVQLSYQAVGEGETQLEAVERNDLRDPREPEQRSDRSPSSGGDGVEIATMERIRSEVGTVGPNDRLQARVDGRQREETDVAQWLKHGTDRLGKLLFQVDDAGGSVSEADL